MKKFTAILLMICLTVSLYGCKQNDSTPATTTEPTVPTTAFVPTAIPQKPMVAVSLPITVETEKNDTGDKLYHFSYQNIALWLPDAEVAHKIIVDYLERVNATRTASDSAKEQAKNMYTPDGNWVPYFHNLTYTPTRMDSGILSLSGLCVDYTGAAHPNHHVQAANYNLVTGDVLTLGSILHHADSHESLKDLVCSELEKVIDDLYLYEDYNETVKQRFTKDPSFDEDWYFTDNGLCFYFAPYEIAPYAAGVITAEIPYSKLSGIIADEFFPPEKETVSGSVVMEALTEEALTKYNQIAEVIIDREGEQKLLYSELGVSNVVISCINSETGESVPVFATPYLTPGDGVMIKASQDIFKTLSITYESMGKTVSIQP